MVDTVHEQVALPPELLAHAAGMFHVLGDPTRLAVLQALMAGPRSVGAVVQATQKGQANVSKHLGILAEAGLVVRTKRGTQAIYEVADPFVNRLCDLVCGAVRARLSQQIVAHRKVLAR